MCFCSYTVDLYPHAGQYFNNLCIKCCNTDTGIKYKTSGSPHLQFGTSILLNCYSSSEMKTKKNIINVLKGSILK